MSWLEIQMGCVHCVGAEDAFRIVARHDTEDQALKAERPALPWDRPNHAQWEPRDGVGWIAANNEWATILIPEHAPADPPYDPSRT